MLAATVSDSDQTPADLVLLHAKIWTGDPGKPEAQALAARGGRIVARTEPARHTVVWNGAEESVDFLRP